MLPAMGTDTGIPRVWKSRPMSKPVPAMRVWVIAGYGYGYGYGYGQKYPCRTLVSTNSAKEQDTNHHDTGQDLSCNQTKTEASAEIFSKEDQNQEERTYWPQSRFRCRGIHKRWVSAAIGMYWHVTYPSPLDLILLVLVVKANTSQRVTLSPIMNFSDALDIIYHTIGCLSITKKPDLTYRLSTSTSKHNQ